MYTIVPFRGQRAMTRNLANSLFGDDFFRSFFNMSDMVGQAGFRVDIREDGDDYLLEAELPGVPQDKIQLTLENDVLTIGADVNTEKRDHSGAYLYSERRMGHVERSFNVEGIRQDEIAARYDNGVLRVTLPKQQPEAKKAQRHIAIAGADVQATDA